MRAVVATMSEAQLVGQLFMMGVPLPTSAAAALTAIRQSALGGAILSGDSRAPLATIRALTNQIREVDARAVPQVGMYIATDQEGGEVQELSGSGFDTIPSALDQGTIDPSQLRADAERWGGQLRAAGVNVDLAPVVDVVPPTFTAINQPIAHFDRELGSDPSTVAAHGSAFVAGLQAAGVSATLKHFPGLGRVVGNTDTTADVTDTVTTPDDPFLGSFSADIETGARFVMVSLATYEKIDPARQAVFSPIVIGTVLRGSLGFRGLIISDDLGGAKAVADVPVGDRAVWFLEAGGDVVLVVSPTSDVATMVAAVEQAARSVPGFGALVRSDAMAVLEAKAETGLLRCP